MAGTAAKPTDRRQPHSCILEVPAPAYHEPHTAVPGEYHTRHACGEFFFGLYCIMQPYMYTLHRKVLNMHSGAIHDFAWTERCNNHHARNVVGSTQRTIVDQLCNEDARCGRQLEHEVECPAQLWGRHLREVHGNRLHSSPGSISTHEQLQRASQQLQSVTLQLVSMVSVARRCSKNRSQATVNVSMEAGPHSWGVHLTGTMTLLRVDPPDWPGPPRSPA